MKSKIEEIILFDYEELKEIGKTEDEIEDIYYELIDSLKIAFDFCSEDISQAYKEYHYISAGYPFIYTTSDYIYLGDKIKVKENYGVNPVEVWQSYINGGATC